MSDRVERSERSVAAGLKHVELTGRAGPGAAPWRAHLLRIDLRRVHVDVALALDQIVGQEAPSSLVQRRGAIAGVNGGFSVSNDPWDIVHGDPDGFLVVDGEVLSEGVADRPSIGFCPGDGRQRVRVIRPKVDVRVRSSDGVIEGVGLNRARESGDGLIAYTAHWSRTTLTQPGGVEVAVERGRVVEVSERGSVRIPADGFVLSADGPAEVELLRRFPIGREVVLEIAVTDDLGRPVAVDGCSFTSAGPVVARDGIVRTSYEGEAYRDGFVVDRHPRTAVGLSRDGETLLLLAIDGRQEGYSAGATLEELAAILVGEGAALVYNLDGGGSTAMVVDGRVVNRPSDGRERRRCDVVLIVPR